MIIARHILFTFWDESVLTHFIFLYDGALKKNIKFFFNFFNFFILAY